MDNKIKAGIALAIIVLVAVIGFSFINESNNVVNQLSPLTESFDYSMEPMTTWDDSKKEYSFNQNISSANGKDYKDITIDILMYNDGKSLDKHTSTINSTEDGSFNLKFTQRLEGEPDEFYYNVTKATEI